jgi:hypothetical protein
MQKYSYNDSLYVGCSIVYGIKNKCPKKVFDEYNASFRE